MGDNLEQENINNETLDNNQENSQTDQKEIRHQQQLEGSRKEVERMVDLFTEKVGEDATVLYKLQETDPKLANRIAKKFGYTDSKEALATYEKQNNSNKEDDFDTRYNQRRELERHEEALEEVSNKINSLDEGTKELVKQAFDDLVEGKKLTTKKAMDYLKMATLFVGKDKISDDVGKENLAQAYSSGITKTSAKQSKDTSETLETLKTLGYRVKDGKVVL